MSRDLADRVGAESRPDAEAASPTRVSVRGPSLRDRLHLLPRQSIIFLVELYRAWISPMRLPTCRFEPTCSGYAVEALTRHGFFYGGLLSVVRLLKCGPWHKPGYDPVPERGLRELFRRRPDAEDPTTNSPSDEVRGI